MSIRPVNYARNHYDMEEKKEDPQDVNEGIMRDYDEKPPEEYICSVSYAMMTDPVRVNCEEGHTFDRESIDTWMREHPRNPTCPTDRRPISRVYPNRDLAPAIQRWQQEHIYERIDSQLLASYILFQDRMPQGANLNAYLRYVGVADTANQVATAIIHLAEEQNVEIPYVRESGRKITLIANGSETDFTQNAANGLRQIFDALQLSQPASSPRTQAVRDLGRDIRRNVGGLHQQLHQQTRQLRDQMNEQTRQLRDQNSQLRDEVRQLHEYNKERQRLDAERAAYNERPLEPREWLRVGAMALLPTVAAMTGRAVGALRDDDPNTTPVREALNFGCDDVVGPATLLGAAALEGPGAIRRQGLVVPLSAALAAGVRGHSSVMSRDQQRRHTESTDSLQADVKALKEAQKGWCRLS